MVLSGDDREQIWYVIGMFAYAAPFVHNLRCLEVPFNAGYDLALLYLSLPAAVFVVLGCRRLRRGLRRQGVRLPLQVVVSAVLFAWIVGLGQAYVVLANALLPPQRLIAYEGVITEKFTSGQYGEGHILRVRIESEHEVLALRVSRADYERLQVGDHISKRMVLGAPHIPYVAHCRWLGHSTQPDSTFEPTAGSHSLAAAGQRER